MPHFISRTSALVLSLALSIGLTVVALVSAPQATQAATITNVTVTSTGPLTAGQANSAPIVVSFTAPTAMPRAVANSAWVGLSNATWVTAPTNFQCGNILTVTNDQNLTGGCTTGDSNVYGQSMGSSTQDWPANTTWTITFAANSVVLPNAATLFVNAATFIATQGGTQYDNGTLSVALTGYVAPSTTVTFDPNSGSGAMAQQSANVATALSANAFTRTGYTFAGWNTAANGTGTAYADGASYRFARSTTLYAQWTPVLATTGNDNQGIFQGALAAIIVGSLLRVLPGVRRKSFLNK